MHHSILPLTRARFRRQFALVAFLVAAGLNLAGCGVNGDFGLVNRDLVRDDIHDWIGREKPVDVEAPIGNFQLTDDERQLRDLAYPLLEPPYNRQKFHSVVSEYGGTPQTLQESADASVYFARLIETNDRSPAARYAQLIDDIRNDITRLPGFFEAAGRVLDLDNKRLRSMALVASLSRTERAQAKERVRENARVVSMVRTSLTRRSASYRFALERLAVMSPMPQAADVDRALAQLNAGIAQYRHGAPTPWSRSPSLAYSQ